MSGITTTFRFEFLSEFPPEGREEKHTGLKREINRNVHPEDKLYQSRESEGGADPPISPRDSVYPKHAVSGPRRMKWKLRGTSA